MSGHRVEVLVVVFGALALNWWATPGWDGLIVALVELAFLGVIVILGLYARP